MYINHNLPAANAARNLDAHYTNLAVSIQHLSTGLRINSAADDAAGLTVRELMRADIAALNQGVRNANDAISMLQVADGALAIIDEKLIRMKELAEQAATGTYDSTQRLMIDSEFQAMGSEIDRIANATDFNGIQLLNGYGPEKVFSKTLSQKMVSSRLNVAGLETMEEVLAGITNPEALGEGVFEITATSKYVYKAGADNQYYVVVHCNDKSPTEGYSYNLTYDPVNSWSNNRGGLALVHVYSSTEWIWNYGGTWARLGINTYDSNGRTATIGEPLAFTVTALSDKKPEFSVASPELGALKASASYDTSQSLLNVNVDLGSGNSLSQTFTARGASSATFLHEVTYTLEIRDITETEEGQNTLAKADANNIAIHFGPMNDAAEDYYFIRKSDASRKGLGLDGLGIQTQEQAQNMLATIATAIAKKDGIRSEYGAMQNRLENTIANQTIQSENLQCSESRISDADIASEMINFVRQQILTHSALAMLAQANSIPQMAIRLIDNV